MSFAYYVIKHFQGPFTPIVRLKSFNNSAMMLVILFSLKAMESLPIGVATHFLVTPLSSMRTVAAFDSDARYKRALSKKPTLNKEYSSMSH